MTPRRAVLAAITLTVALSACAGSEPDPAVARKERVQARLGGSFTSEQAACIVDALDPAALVALDRMGDLEGDSPEMTTYTEAVVACTAEP